MFTINLYQNTSPPNYVDKSITSIGEYSGVLRDESSIINPVVRLEIESAPTANYAYIAEFNRYYYITNISSFRNKLWDVAMHVDVLMTYKSQIRSQEAVVARQARRYNLYLDDGWFMAYQNPQTIHKPLSITNAFEAQEYVLIIAGS